MNKNNVRTAPLLLVNLLESFSKKELEGLQQVSNYAYFNTDKLVVKLLDVLIKHILGKNWTPETAQVRMYTKVFNDASTGIEALDKKQKVKLNKKMSLLTRLAEQYLQIEALKKSQSNRCELLMESLIDRKQYRLFNKHLVKEKKSIKNAKKDIDYFDKLHLFEKEEFIYLMSSGKWMEEDNFEKLNESIDLQYLAKKLNYTITGISIMNYKNKKYNFSFLKHLWFNSFLKKKFDKSPIFMIQDVIINLYLSKKHDLYLKLLDLLAQYETVIGENYTYSFYTDASNFCISLAKMGKAEYFKHFVDLCKVLDNRNLLLYKNSLSITKLRNMVTYGCLVKDFDWVETIIEKYTPYLQKKYRDDVIKFSLGYLEFEQKNYQYAIDLLLQVNNFQKSYDINKRIMILKSYYELEEHYSEPTAQLFRSMESFIKNHKLLTHNDKTMYKTFIRIFYNLYRIKHRVGTIQLAKLKERIENAEFISNKLWLLEKIAELEGRR